MTEFWYHFRPQGLMIIVCTGGSIGKGLYRRRSPSVPMPQFVRHLLENPRAGIDSVEINMNSIMINRDSTNPICWSMRFIDAIIEGIEGYLNTTLEIRRNPHAWWEDVRKRHGIRHDFKYSPRAS